IGQRCHEARGVAEALGHKLLGFRFRYGQGATTCQTCGGTGLVSDELIGVAFTMPCKRGEPFPEVPATPAPPTGTAKRLPSPHRRVSAMTCRGSCATRCQRRRG